MSTVKTISKWTGIVFGAILLLIAVAYGAMRMNDGPVEFYPWFTVSIGGPFRSGELTVAPESWEFLREREEIEIQTLNPTTSRTVWAPIVEGELFIVSGYMNSPIGRLWKQWPATLEEDNRILIRDEGKIYEQCLQRVLDEPQKAVPVLAELGRKYFGGSGELIPGSEIAVTSGSVWMFEVTDCE
ncbi:MAG: hypothetical protein COB20_05950 [SAR86 cluster bacterium]|uniref:Uncharacterized protein n=1 Tax=SAR86 cluster bacterium TaxID=2030880 RepID=A0A2A4X8G4_9GAMM|nr:MAG: hypothetical protein COB20_05950 [SAR86 cluster bacterium]